MPIYSSGYSPAERNPALNMEQQRLLMSNIDLINSQADQILGHRDYFFCQLAFAYCGWAYIAGDGPLHLGHLVLGWKEGSLVETCPECSMPMPIWLFAGSILSGSNCWQGFCLQCNERRTSHSDPSIFSKRMKFAMWARQSFPYEIAEWEEYDGYIFSWGGNGLAPSRKNRLVWRRLADPVTLETLISELASGTLRPAEPVQPKNLDGVSQLKFTRKDGSEMRFP